MSESETAPLLGREEPFTESELALLKQQETKHVRRDQIRMGLCLILAIILTSSAVAFTFFFAKKSLGRSRSVIMMVSDGFGPASQTYGRSFYQYINNATEGYMSPLDKIFVGTSRTRSSDSLVTDSAAGATAFACGIKTYNAAIAVDPERKPCGTILEAAKDLGMLTGIVVTSRVTHATPASFSAHVIHRDMEADIAVQQIGDYPLKRQIDLLMGGGRCFFLPNTTEGSCRTDHRDLIKEGQELYGWKYVMNNRQDFDQLNNNDDDGIPLPALGLFHQDHMNYEIDRNPEKEPSLSEMAAAALKSLKGNAGTNQGFFLLIEGSRIDMAAHNNDPVGHVHDILEYHRTVAVVRDFVNKNPDTLLISTSDHETGGFTLGFQDDPKTYPEYLWKPEVIKRARASTEVLTARLMEYQGKDRRSFVKDEILGPRGLMISDPTDEELTFLSDPKSLPADILVFLGHAISRRASLGWTTIGHTGVDVNIYADGDNDGFKDLWGNHENTDIGDALIRYLNVDLSYITKRLAKDAEKWFKSKRDGFWSTSHARSHHEETGH